MNTTKKLRLSIGSALLFMGLCTYSFVPVHASQDTTEIQATETSTQTDSASTEISTEASSSADNANVTENIIPSQSVNQSRAAATTQKIKLSTPLITVTTGYQSATISWKAVTGTPSTPSVITYKVSCSDGRYINISSTSKVTTHTFDKLKEGQTYSFTVQASATNATASSARSSATIPTTVSQNVTGLSTYASNDRINLKWDTLYGASGYWIYQKNGTTYTFLGSTAYSNFQTSITGGATQITFMVKPYTTINGKNYTSATGSFVSCVPNTLISPLKTVRTMTYFCKTTKKVSLYRSWTSKKVVKTLNKGVTVDLTGRNSKYKRSQILYKGKTYYLTTGSLRAYQCNYTTAKYSTAQKLDFVKKYSSKTKYLIWISHYTQEVNIFQGKKGNWKLIKTFPCATGKYSTRSPRGTYRIGQKEKGWYYVNTYEEYVTHYCGRNSFHTRVHRYPAGSSQNHHKFPIASTVYADATIGKPVSNGCVRLMDSDAYYIWKYMPKSTSVISY